MHYAILIYDEESASPAATPVDPSVAREVSAAYLDYTRMLRERGAFLAGDALQPATTATTIRIREGQTMTTDGPFAETKEALGGFYLIEAKDLDEALEFAAACPGAQWGSIEVRPIWNYATPPANS